MITHYYEDVRFNARMAFIAAFSFGVIAVLFFVCAVSKAMDTTFPYAAFSVLSGFLIQIMTGIVFYLHSQSSRQFSGFHICLERTNRFLVANSITEQLEGDDRTKKKTEVITAMLNAPMLTLSMIEKGIDTNAIRAMPPYPSCALEKNGAVSQTNSAEKNKNLSPRGCRARLETAPSKS